MKLKYLKFSIILDWGKIKMFPIDGCIVKQHRHELQEEAKQYQIAQQVSKSHKQKIKYNWLFLFFFVKKNRNKKLISKSW